MVGLVSAFLEVLPFPRTERQANYVGTQLGNEELKQNIQNLENAIAVSTKDGAKGIREHSIAQFSKETEQLNSIITRGQALLAFTAFFGVFVSLAADVLLSDKGSTPPLVWALRIIGSYIVVQIVLLIVNTLNTIGATLYTDIGSSELASFAKACEHEFAKQYAKHKLEHYRRTAITNSWRMDHLVRAQKCLRNIGFGMAVIVLTVLWFPAKGAENMNSEEVGSTPLANEKSTAYEISRSRYYIFRDP